MRLLSFCQALRVAARHCERCRANRLFKLLRAGVEEPKNIVSPAITAVRYGAISQAMYGMARYDRQLSSFPQAARTRRTAAVPWAGLAGVMEPVKRCTWHEVPAVDGCSPQPFLLLSLCACVAQPRYRSPYLVMRLMDILIAVSIAVPHARCSVSAD